MVLERLDARQPTSFHAAYELLASQRPELPALLVASTSGTICTMTFAELDQRGRELARGLSHYLRRRDHACVLHVAVNLPRTHLDFLALLLGLSRCRLPFILMSVGLPNRDLEEQRNQYILSKLEVGAIIQDEMSQVAGPEATPQVLTLSCLSAAGANEPGYEEVGEESAALQDEVLALMFTGGTRQMKVVKVKP